MPRPSSTVLEYFDPSQSRRATRLRLARCFAATLSVSASTLAFGAAAQGWVQNPVLELGAFLLVVVAASLALRTLNLCKVTFRSGWISGVVVFGLWAAIISSNQTHGRPPPSDRYFIVGFGLSSVLSAVALAFDPRPPTPT